MPKIVIYPNKLLRKKTEEIKKLDKQAKEDIDTLVKVLANCEDGAGLAGPQVGILKRFLGLKDRLSKKVTVYINPKITKTYGKKEFLVMEKEGGNEDFLEGCLSFPNYFGTVKRFFEIDLSWQEIGRNGLKPFCTKKLTGLEAVVIQHEIDHLDGVLFVDHVKEDGGKFYKLVGNELIAWNVDEIIKD